MRARIFGFLILGSLSAFAEPPPDQPVKTKIVRPSDGIIPPRVEIVPIPEEEKPVAPPETPVPPPVPPSVPASPPEQPIQPPTSTSTENPAVENAIPSPVKALPAPQLTSFPGGIVMAISTPSDQAQLHVLQGLNHLHGGWEFEASRHFAVAMREDPDCLLAFWGMVMCTLSPTPETSQAREGAANRLLDLVDQGRGTELERGYAYAIIKYLQEGPAGAASAFRKVAKRFPNEVMAGIFAALFDRTGYDDLGTATPAQEIAENELLALIEKFPTSAIPLHALLSIRAEAPQLADSLGMARKLCQIMPDYPPYYHLLGHYEWRCGNFAEATAAFGKAASFFQTWMKNNQATLADCPEWIKSECYRIVSMASKGDFDNAYATARRLATTPLPDARPSSPGARFLLWDAKTLPARLLLHRGLRGNAHEALVSIAKPKELKKYHSTSLANWWIDGLRLCLEARRLIDAGDLSQAKDVAAALTHHGEAMAKTQAAAAASGERSEWVRTFKALEILASDVRGRIAMAGPPGKRGPAYNWFSSAADRQRPTPALFPPLILTPLAQRVGDYFLAEERPEEAIEAYQRALALFPNDKETLTSLKQAYQNAKLPEKAEEIQRTLQKLTN